MRWPYQPLAVLLLPQRVDETGIQKLCFYFDVEVDVLQPYSQGFLFTATPMEGSAMQRYSHMCIYIYI